MSRKHRDDSLTVLELDSGEEQNRSSTLEESVISVSVAVAVSLIVSLILYSAVGISNISHIVSRLEGKIECLDSEIYSLDSKIESLESEIESLESKIEDSQY